MSEPAGFRIRLVALLLDALIVAVPLTAITLWMDNSRAAELATDAIAFLYGLLTPIFWNGYTISKRICNIRIVSAYDGEPPNLWTMLLRNLVSGIVYGITLGLAVIASAVMVAVREDKRSLHDFIAGTEVVRD